MSETISPAGATPEAEPKYALLVPALRKFDDSTHSYALTREPRDIIKDLENIPGREPDALLELSHQLDLLVIALRSGEYDKSRRLEAECLALAEAVEKRTLKDISPETLESADPKVAATGEMRALLARIQRMRTELAGQKELKNSDRLLRILDTVIGPAIKRLTGIQTQVGEFRSNQEQLTRAGYDIAELNQRTAARDQTQREWANADRAAFSAATDALHRSELEREVTLPDHEIREVSGLESRCAAMIDGETTQHVSILHRTQSPLARYFPVGSIVEMAENGDVADLIKSNQLALNVFGHYQGVANEIVKRNDYNHEQLIREWEVLPAANFTGGFGPVFVGGKPADAVKAPDAAPSVGQKLRKGVGAVAGGVADVVTGGKTKSRAETQAREEEINRRAEKILEIAQDHLPLLIETLRERKQYLLRLQEARETRAQALQLRSIVEIASVENPHLPTDAELRRRRAAIDRISIFLRGEGHDKIDALQRAQDAALRAREHVEEMNTYARAPRVAGLLAERTRIQGAILTALQDLLGVLKAGLTDNWTENEHAVGTLPEGLVRLLRSIETNTFDGQYPADADFKTWLTRLEEVLKDSARQKGLDGEIDRREKEIQDVLEKEFLPAYRRIAAAVHTTEAKPHADAAETYKRSFDTQVSDIESRRVGVLGRFFKRLTELRSRLAETHRTLTALLEVARSAAETGARLEDGNEAASKLTAPSAAPTTGTAGVAAAPAAPAATPPATPIVEPLRFALARTPGGGTDSTFDPMEDLRKRYEAARAPAAKTVNEERLSMERITTAVSQLGEHVLPFLRSYAGLAGGALEQQRASIQGSVLAYKEALVQQEKAETELNAARKVLEALRLKISVPSDTDVETLADKDPTNARSRAKKELGRIEIEIAELKKKIESAGKGESSAAARVQIKEWVARLGHEGKNGSPISGKYKELKDAENAYAVAGLEGLTKARAALQAGNERELRAAERRERDARVNLETAMRRIEFEGEAVREKIGIFLAIRQAFRSSTALQTIATEYMAMGSKDLQGAMEVFARLVNPTQVALGAEPRPNNVEDALTFYQEHLTAEQYALFYTEEQAAIAQIVMRAEQQLEAELVPEALETVSPSGADAENPPVAPPSTDPAEGLPEVK